MVNFKKLRQIISIQGNGNIVSKEFEISSFIRLHLAIQGNAELIQSDDEKVVVETDENLLDTFEVVNSGSTLYVTSESKLRTPAYTHCMVKVYYRQLEKLINSSNGNLTIGTPITLSNELFLKIQSNGNTDLEVDVPSLKLLNQCNGNLSLKGKCGQLEIKNQANGNLLARGLKANTATIKNLANGNVELYAEESISIYHLGNGFVHYFGPGKLTDVKQYGSGAVKHMKE